MKNLITIVCLLFAGLLMGQVTETANDRVMPYEGEFRPSSNIGYFPPFTQEELANLAAGNEALGVPGLGVKSFRPFLTEAFMEQYGYDFFVDDFKHYQSVGLLDNTLVVGFPQEAHQDTEYYCDGIRSELFSNLYTPIWDNGQNGTPVNDDNYYALYLYKMVTTYKDYVKFWEIWNEPGFDFSRTKGFLPPNETGNWWDNNPDPCDYKLRAPIFHYVRMLRISYEIIHTYDPESYVTVSGVGFPSFLDAILRNTDNPTDGAVSADYPLKGGAYFDVIGFHSYPHFDGSLRSYDPVSQSFSFFRHSDAAAAGIAKTQDELQTVLTNYGYDDTTYPEKHWTITELNLPRKAIGDFAGGDEVQRNYMIKAYVESVRRKVLQLHVYHLAENEEIDVATNEFDVMGLYKRMDYSNLYFQEPTEAGIAYKSTSDQLFGKTYDPIRTAALELSGRVDGAAFEDEFGNYTYVLWAKTLRDQSEFASARFSFPMSLGIDNLYQRGWDVSQTAEVRTVSSQGIDLTGAPIFLTEGIFSISDAKGCAPLGVDFQSDNIQGATTYEWQFEGGTPASSTSSNPSVNYPNAGSFEVQLEVKNASGAILASQITEVNIGAEPTAGFDATISGPIVLLNNSASSNTSFFSWDFGDGESSDAANPTHVYSSSGSFLVELTVTNECGMASFSETITVDVPEDPNPASTAKDAVTAYNGPFRPAANLGYYGPQWTDESLADLAAGNLNEDIPGIGAKAIRPYLPEIFLEQYGYELRLPAFQHYQNIGLIDNTMIVGFPSKAHQEPINYCQSYQSELFAGMYDDIWDNGENGTPVNDDNYFALYLYRTANLYKDYVKFWEIWNEPGFDFTGTKGFLPPGTPGNWWDNNPDPCDYKLRAPVFHMVRMLRVSYEVIKSVDPDALITFSGIGYASFLDAVMRNSDNPDNGEVTANYPHKGGAYFDVVGFHTYPHFDGSLRSYDANVGAFVYNRNSDEAADGILNAQVDFKNVLQNYGYDGSTYPEKHWIITECNIPRKPISGSFGGDEAQVNYVIKAYVKSMIGELLQLHMYKIGEEKDFADATDEFEVMGLYENLNTINPAEAKRNDEGIAFKTASDQLFMTEYDAAKTNEMALSADLGGAAFVDANGKYTYVLWAKATMDNSESANATYSFPPSMNISNLFRKEWDYALTEQTTNSDGQNINLTASPIFLSETLETPSLPLAVFEANTQEDCLPFSIQFTSNSQNATTHLWTFPGGTPATSTETNPIVEYTEAGVYDVVLKVTNALGEHESNGWAYITAKTKAKPSFEFDVDAFRVTFTNTSSDATSYQWDFDDGQTSNLRNPRHTYRDFGTYTVKLTATNAECGPIVTTQTVEIVEYAQANQAVGCQPMTVDFINNASNPDSLLWTFPGGTPASSTAPNPTVVYNNPGTYDVILQIYDDQGGLLFTRPDYIEVAPLPVPSFVITGTLPNLSFANTSTFADSYLWDFGDGTTSLGYNPSHTYRTTGEFTVTLTAINDCASITTTQTVSIERPPTADFQSGPTEKCGPFNLYFQDKSTFSPDTWFWAFEGGDPAVSTDKDVLVYYKNPGRYNVILKVSNAYGEDEVVRYNHIVSAAPPAADFTTILDGRKASFTNRSAQPADFLWEFGDGSTSTEVEPVHLYAEAGTYEVVLTTTNACGTDIYRQMVETAPAPSFSFELGAGCTPMGVTFSDESSGTVSSRLWSFPGGIPATSTEANPVVTYVAAGLYDVTLMVENASGSAEVVQTEAVEIGAKPAATFTRFEDDLKVSFFSDVKNASTYLWEFGDGMSSTEVDPEHTYQAEGTYEVKLTVGNACGSNTTTTTVELDGTPFANFSIDTMSGCRPIVVTYTDASGGAINSWLWQFPGGLPATSIMRNPEVRYLNSGTYRAILRVSNNRGTHTVEMENYIEVLNNPLADFDVDFDGAEASFNVPAIVGGAQYRWDFGDGFTSGENEPVHVYEQNGDYTVRLIVENECGTDSIAKVITIAGPPVSFFAVDTKSACEETSVQFFDLSSSDTESWSWSFPGGVPATSTEQNPVVRFSGVGEYEGTLTATNANGNSSYTQLDPIIIYEFPVAEFTYETEAIDSVVLAIFKNSSSGAGSYFWDFGDGWNADTAEPTHIYETNGTYKVTMTVENDCGIDTMTQWINVLILDVEAISLQKNIDIFPNPSNGQFSILADGLDNAELDVRVLNILGERVYADTYYPMAGGLKEQLNLTHLPKGTYLLQLTNGDQQTAVKLVLQ